MEYIGTGDNKKKFLRYDSGLLEDGRRIMIFATDEGLEIISNSTIIFLDGTFDIPLFAQLVTLHGNSGEKTMPGVFCLLTDKQENTYQLMLQQLKALVVSLFINL